MPLLPISTARTSTPLATQRLLFQLNADQIELQRHFDQLSSGRRVLRISDDPAAAGRAIGLHQGIDRGNQLIQNAQATNRFYQSADDALARVGGALIEARGVTVAAAQNLLSEDERMALSYTIQQTIGTVFSAGNSIYRDQQLLGGFLGQGHAFQYDGNDIVFRGNEAIGRTALGSGAFSDINVTGSDSLGAGSVFLVGKPLQAAVDADTRLVDLRQGKGVTPGLIRLSGGANWVDLGLSTAATLGDVADMITGVSLEGRELVASLTLDGIRVEYADGLSGTLAIVDGEGSQMAVELSISNPDGLTAPPLIGSQLSLRVTSSTKIQSLRNGAGLNLSGGIQLVQGTKTFTINLSQAETLGDVLIAINRSGADIRAELQESQGRIQLRSLRSGVDYSLGENGGQAASQLGIRSATEQTLLADLGRGQGMKLNPDGPDLLIDRPDGGVLAIDLEGAQTIEDVILRIRNHPMNQDTLRVLVNLNAVGNGLELRAPPGAAPLSVRQTGSSNAGNRLGLIPAGSDESTGMLVGSTSTIIGADYVPRDAGGTLDTLLRLQRAVLEGDEPEISRLQAQLDLDLDRASRARGRVGVWANNLEQLRAVAEDRVVRLRSQFSDEVEADLATVISEINQRQLALEASMRIIGQTAQMSLLNFL